jgi:hypothetical protein
MTSLEIKSRVLFLLDDEDADYWTESDVYQAISAGQLEIFKRGLAIFIQNNSKLPYILTPFQKETDAAAAGKKNKFPPSFQHLISARYEHNVAAMTSAALPVIIQKKDYNFYSDRKNPYFQGADKGPVGWYSIDASGDECLEIETTDTNYGMIQLNYLKTPDAINESVNPEINTTAHESLVQYAYASLLLRDEQFQASAAEMNKFNQMLAGVIL